MNTERKRLLTCLAIIGICSYYLVFQSKGQAGALGFPAFLALSIAGLVLYQNFEQYFSNTSIGILAFFFGRLIFLGMVIYVNYWLISHLQKKLIDKDGISTYAIGGQIASKYQRGKWHFFRHYRYFANGQMIEKEIPYNEKLISGDTIYLRYSASRPHVIEFEQNEQNRRHGIFD